MYVHEGARLVYLANPRTASRAVAKALEGVGFELVGSHHSGLEDTPEGVMGYRLVFSVVRDVGETIQSWCRKLGCDPATFLVKHLPAQRSIIATWPDQPHTLFPHARDSDLVIQYAEIEERLNHLLRIHGVAPVTLERVP